MKLGQILKVHISVIVWQIQLKFETRGAPPQGSFSSKNGARYYQAMDA